MSKQVKTNWANFLTPYNLWWLRGVPVTFHLAPPLKFRWTNVHGIRVGSWFIGAIRGIQEESPGQEGITL